MGTRLSEVEFLGQIKGYLGDLITLAEAYGQYFQWEDGKVYPQKHARLGQNEILLLCRGAHGRA